MFMKDIYDLYTKVYPDKLPSSLEELAPLKDLLQRYKVELLSSVPYVFSWKLKDDESKEKLPLEGCSRLASYLDLLQGQTPYTKLDAENDFEKVLLSCTKHYGFDNNLNALLSIATPEIGFKLKLKDIWVHYHEV